jgi:predicted AlkP superfamily pyrophosphatase or phosphodiesterase
MKPMGRFAVCLALACAPAAAAAPGSAPVKHVVIVVVDGLRPDAIARAPAPRLQALARASAMTGTARVVEQPETLPSFFSMVTALAPSAHGVTWNNDRGVEYAGDTLFTRVHGAGRRTGLYFGKSKLSMLAPRGSADHAWGPGPKKAHRERGTSDSVAARFAEDFARERLALALVHLKEADTAGHDHGWLSPQYFEALGVVDRGLGVVLDAIQASGRAGATALLLTSDHGGEGDNHGPGRGDTSFLIPFLCRAPGVRAADIARPVTLLDVAPTALALLGLPPLAGAQGRVVTECLPTSAR